MFAVLVNPAVPVETAQVFGALGLSPGAAFKTDADPTFDCNAAVLLKDLARTRNDLEAPARKLAPVIGDALALLGADPECRLARMSGSGATVFGLFDDCRASAAAAKVLQPARPGWWVKATVLR
jgi:4-diphosphocytidyl-2-C-methyl-D-erythritol kinase